MRRHRTTARATLVALFLAGLGAAALSSPASGTQQGAVPRLVFPLVAKTDLWDNYGDPRGNGRHAGIDMENPWRAPVVAVEDGTVKYWESGLGGCMLYHYGRSGTTYLYIHLNNDLTPRNDNKGGCVNGVDVRRSQRREGDGGPADRLERRLGRRERQPAPPLRGASERRCRREPVQAPEAREQAAVRGTDGSRLQPRRSAAISSPQERARPRSRSTRVRQYPGGRWLDVDPREVELTVPLGADVAPSLVQLERLDAPHAEDADRGLGVHAQGERDAGGDPRCAGELMLGRVAPTP